LSAGAACACEDSGSSRARVLPDASVDDARPAERDIDLADAAVAEDLSTTEPFVASAPVLVEVDEDGEVRFRLDGSGGRGTLTINVVGLPASGTLEPTFGPPPLEVVYRPMPDFAGEDAIELRGKV
jgi:hypothetical protein